jgi:hypothetical protein
MPYNHKFITNIYDKKGTRLLSHVYKHSGTITIVLNVLTADETLTNKI